MPAAATTTDIESTLESAHRLDSIVGLGRAGFEPATFAVSGRRPNQASPNSVQINLIGYELLDDRPTHQRGV